MRAAGFGPAPADVVTGIDPDFTILPVTVTAFSCSCGRYTALTEAELEQHRMLLHAADRSDALTCHLRPSYDADRWCVRPRDHELADDDEGHWTPSLGGGVWWPSSPTDREVEDRWQAAVRGHRGGPMKATIDIDKNDRQQRKHG